MRLSAKKFLVKNKRFKHTDAMTSTAQQCKTKAELVIQTCLNLHEHAA